MFWGPRDYESIRSWIPDGDADLQRAWLHDYSRAVEWMRQVGVPVSERFSPIMTIGVGYPIKIPYLHDLHRKRIEMSKNGSKVQLNTQVLRLLQEFPGLPGSRVIGAILRCAPSSEGAPQTYIEVTAKNVILATGGFQGSSEMRSRYIGSGTDTIFVRSNKGSVGDGLTIASQVGAGTSRGMGTFYGHLLAAPLRREDVDPEDFLSLAQYQSKHCLLLNEAGKRFVDESLGDEIVNQHLARQENRRGFLLFDDKTRRDHCLTALFPNAGDIDRLELARSRGCNVASASTIEGLVSLLEGLGIDGAQTHRTIKQYHQAVVRGEADISLAPQVGRGGTAPASLIGGQAPFFAMEVQPSITFTYGGIRIDEKGHALTPDNIVIPGLLAAGVDAGGFSNVGYAGGLALAFVTGFWAAREVSRDMGLPELSLPEVNPQDSDLVVTSHL
ncbi:hypothetical protein LTR84_004034 [Exophiala bonariae]|uniref:FAD-dependent oxidoreductase 2 FAD-binding domain-containing protein n=1 Tax=Exophiala bonariae TaxID=1690606 RepID=A0AAV9N527_9EURO|nr:hypothetical protein LTR84_004034 [Exophiala bonariae]